MKKIFEKYSVPRYIISSYIKFLFGAGAFLGVVFGILKLTGLYEQLESVLDLKYNSPFVLVPLYGFAVLAALSFVIGALQYFHKYKRTKMKGTFNKFFSAVLDEKNKRMEK